MSRPALLAIVGLATGCGEDFLEITVLDRPALRAPTTLRIEIDDGTDRVSDELTIAAVDQLPLTFVVATTGRGGEATIAIDGVDQDGRLVGRGVATAPLGGDTALAITLEPADFVVNREGVVGGQVLTEATIVGARQLTAAPDGGFLIAWQGDRSTWARTFGPDARPRVNDDTLTDREFEIISPDRGDGLIAAAHAIDSYAVVWEAVQDGMDNSTVSVQTYRDDTVMRQSINGQFVEFSETLNQRFAMVAGLAGGGFAITWLRTADRFGTSGELRLRIVDPLGVPLEEPSVVVGSDEAEVAPAAVGLIDGGVAVVWEVKETSERSRLVFRILDGTTPRTAQLDVDQPVAEPRREAAPSAAALPDGGLVIVWYDDTAVTDAIRARWFDADGTPRGDAIEVAVDGVERNQCPAIAVGPAGLAIAWVVGVEDQRDVMVRRYGLDGVPLTDAVPLATTVDGAQHSPSLAPHAADGFVAAWTDASQAAPDDSLESVRARVLYVDP